jgi:type III restriction enzyme
MGRTVAGVPLARLAAGNANMAQVIIPNPILNTPFDEPRRHFYFDEDGITDKVIESRRLSSYFVPVPHPRKRARN